MPPMPATFLCPHCSASYPVKPVLVGRAVRCTTCRSAFRLRADGVADKVVDEAPAPTPEPAPEPVAPEAVAPVVAGSADRNGHAAGGGPGSGSSGQRAATAGGAKRTDRLNRKQDEMRRSMAATLASAANEALKAESVLREPPEKSAARTARLVSAPADGGVGKIGPAVLTGYGRREFRNNLTWLFGCLGSIVLVAGLGWLVLHKSAAQYALHQYVRNVASAENQHGKRLRAIQDRAWMAGQPPLDGLGNSLRVQSSRRFPLTQARAVASELGLSELEYLGKPPLWVKADQTVAVRERWKENLDRAANLAAVMTIGTVVDHQVVVGRLTEAGIPPDVQDLLLALIKGPLSPKSPPDLGKRLFAADGPDAIDLCRFNGSRGELLFEDGPNFKHRTVDFEGWLLRFVGGGLPQEWRVLTISTSSRR